MAYGLGLSHPAKIRKDVGLLPGASEEGLRALVSETYNRALSEAGTKATEARLSLPLRQALDRMWGRAATSAADLVQLGEALESFGEELRRILAEAAVFGSVEAAPGRLGARLGINLRLANPYTRAWAVTRSAELVRHVRPELALTIREATTRAVVDGWHPTVLAKRLRRTVGLLPQHQAAVDRYEAGLLEAKLPPRQAARLAGDYANRLRDYRARNIARTELLTAHNKGQQLTWEANVREGLIPQTMRRAWVVTRSDALTCEGCRSMTGVTTTVDGLFQTPWGERACPPAHPSCRCTSSLVPATLTEDERAELLAPWSEGEAVEKGNPNHEPAGSPKGGRFASNASRGGGASFFTALKAGHRLYRSAQEETLHISERGESGPGAYLTDDRNVAEGYLRGKRDFAPHARLREYSTTKPLRMLDRSSPEGEAFYREHQRDPATYKLRTKDEFLAAAKKAGFDGVVYPGATGTEREIVIHDPSVLTLVSVKGKDRPKPKGVRKMVETPLGPIAVIGPPKP